MQKEIVNAGRFSEIVERAGVPLSPLVRAGDFLFCSGMPPFDPESGKLVKGGIEVQTRQVLENIKRLLAGAGSSLDKVVKTNVYVANAAYFSVINEIYREYFPADPPARTFVPVAGWPMEFDIEIECVAIA